MKRDYAIFILLILILLLSDKVWYFKKYLISNPTELSELLELRQENLILKSQIVELENFKIFKPYLNLIKPAFVFSRYPFNLKSEVLINLGSKDGVTTNTPVVLLPISENDSNFIFIGKVINVLDKFSTVQTIFDPNLKLAVKINTSTNALFIGGPKPVISLIPKNFNILKEEIVYVADINFPYGLIIGKINQIRPQNDLFNEADVIFSYDLNQINSVALIK